MSELTFETAMQQLEQITAQLEQGKLALEQATELYEKGTVLAKYCSEQLNNAELKIKQLCDEESANECK